MANIYDLIVIGSGTAATGAAFRTAAAGWKVAVIDFRPYGGTCALRGRDPQKMLITGAQVMDDIRRTRFGCRDRHGPHDGRNDERDDEWHEDARLLTSQAPEIWDVAQVTGCIQTGKKMMRSLWVNDGL